MRGYLPSSAEWGFAYQAGTTTLFYYGDFDDESVIKEYTLYRNNVNSKYWTVLHAENEGAQIVATRLPNNWVFTIWQVMLQNILICFKKEYENVEINPIGILNGSTSSSIKTLQKSQLFKLAFFHFGHVS